MVSYNLNDLDFILQQIKISEQAATTEDANGAPVAGTPLTDLIPNPLLPWGVRTVDGTYNNIIPGREDFGSADELFPRLLDPVFQDGDPLPFDPDGPGPLQAGDPTSYQQTSGLVFDGQPRTISNLVVDQTLSNPAAILAALKYVGVTGAEAQTALIAIQAANATLQAAELAAGPALAALNQATADLNTALAQQATAAAADTAAQSALAAYSVAVPAADSADDAALAALLASSTVLTSLSTGAPAIDAGDIAAVSSAVAAATNATNAANAVVAALTGAAGVNPADLAAAEAAAANAAALLAEMQALEAAIADNSADPVDIVAAIAAATTATNAFLASSGLTGQLQSALTAATADAVTAAADLATADQAVIDAQDVVDAVTLANATALADVTAAQTALDTELASREIEMTDNGTIIIPNVAPDEGISAPFNSWMTLFGQFFDHGLDLLGKGGSGTVFIPLQPDDPLYDANSQTNFLVVTRATNQPGPDGILGTADDIREHKNSTTPFVDQNQTYTSHSSHQVFLREYVMREGVPVATGHLLEGSNGGLATWADIKQQASDMLGIELTDADIVNVPLLATDEYGRFLRGPDGFAQVVMDDGNGGVVLVEGDPNAPLDLTDAIRTGHAFLDDIAHAAAPYGDHDGNPSTPNQLLIADADTDTGGSLDPTALGEYDNELLDRHFITGDGRGNENIGLTTVHHVFHSEHNRLTEHTKDVVVASGDLTFINEWLVTPLNDISEIPTTPAGIDALDWNGERLFQAARFGTEMQYQHLVFEEFARKVNPMVDLFVFNPTMDIDPAIFAEFAHVVYRFGHSMLTETVDRLAADGQTTDDIGLIEAFLNPVEFDKDGALTADQAAGAIARGMTRQQGNEIDEFVTEALRNNLLGLPLDLATINMVRARETGVPSLQGAREQFYEMTKSEWLKPYENWVDFAQNLKNPASIINIIAAYGTHASILNETTLEGKRDAATLLVLGGVGEPADRLAFLNGTGAYTDLGGLNDVDFWLGGLAEAILPFGGMLGSTFTFVFEMQMENLQNGDRFYYLSRTQGLNFLTELENNAFSKIIMKNTDLGEEGATHLPGEIFSTPQHILEINQAIQNTPDPVHDDPVLAALQDKVARDQNLVVDGNTYDNSLKFIGGEHAVLGGTNQNDVLIGDLGDDTIWGDGGDDYIIGGHGINRLHGGTGDDIIYGGGDPEFIHGDEGNDVIHAGNGIGDLVFGGAGHDFVFAGIDGTEVFGGEGNDFILGTPDMDFLLGGGGDDWIEGGEGFDTLAGDNSELFFNSTVIGHDVLFSGTNESDFDAESGDDIMVQGESVMRNEGMLGFDWVSFQEHTNFGVTTNMNIGIFTTVFDDILRNRFDRVEALSTTIFDDVIIGDSRTAPTGPFNPALPVNEQSLEGDELLVSGVNRITGLNELLGISQVELDAMSPEDIVFNAGNILLGNGGSDRIQGEGGDDIIDGDSALQVRIGIVDDNGVEIGTAFSMQGPVAMVDQNSPLHGRPLDELVFNRSINPGNLQIVREIIDGGQQGDVDVAVYRGSFADYTITQNLNGSWAVQHNVDAALIDDGTDTLWNVEVLEFADAVQILDPNIVNTPAIGELEVLDSTPGTPAAVGDTFTVALGTVADAEGVPALATFNVAWQVETDPGIWEAIVDPLTEIPVTGLSFTPIAAMELEGLRIRAAASFVGGNGIPEFVLSASTVALAAASTGLPTEGDDVLFGTVGDDVIDALGGDDIVFGFAGNDILTGGAGSDILDGGDGIDVAVFNGPVSDFTFELNAEGQLEVIETATGEEDAVIDIEVLRFIDGANETNLLVADILDGETINGTAGADTLVGTAFNDAINGLGGADTIDGGDGDDTINGAGGADNIDGGRGNDTIFGGGGADIIRGGDGNDVINAGGGNDEIDVGLGNDIVNGGAGVDTVIFAGDLADFTLGFTTAGGLTVTDNATGDVNQIVNVENLEFDDQTITQATAEGTANITRLGAGAQTFNGTGANEFVSGGGGGDTLNGGGGNDVLLGEGGNDTVNGGAGDDTIIWNAVQGRDLIDGGDDVDTVIINGNAANETFRVYARADADAAGISGLNAATEIVITRNGTDNASVIAELANVEEIQINTGGGTNTVIPIGDFLPTSLNFNTITINGSDGDDDIDITGLLSDHRIVFQSNGGNDTLRGQLRPQDVIMVAAGTMLADYVTTDNGDGTTTMSNGLSSITFASSSTPILADENTVLPVNDEGEPTDTGGGSGTGTDTGAGSGTPAVVAGVTLTGSSTEDLLIGGEGDDFIAGGAGTDTINAMGGSDVVDGGSGNDNILAGSGNDTIFAGEGDDRVFAGAGNDTLFGDAGDDFIWGEAGNDVIFGGAGNDRIWGGDGDDMIEGGAGDDIVDAGAGNDTLVATMGDGNDIYNGGAGNDTYDISATTANAVIDLAAGTASSDQIGTDFLANIENATGGFGSDTIIASNAVNVLTGGVGADSFVFNSAAAANGDLITDFQAGDRIDISGIDANPLADGSQQFQLVDQAVFGAAGQISFHFEQRDGIDYTVVEANISGGDTPDFALDILGQVQLTRDDFNGVIAA